MNKGLWPLKKRLLIAIILGLAIVIFFIFAMQRRVAPPPLMPQQPAELVPVGYPQATPHPLTQQYMNCIACHNMAEIAGHDRKWIQQCLQCHIGFEPAGS